MSDYRHQQRAFAACAQILGAPMIPPSLGHLLIDVSMGDDFQGIELYPPFEVFGSHQYDVINLFPAYVGNFEGDWAKWCIFSNIHKSYALTNTPDDAVAVHYYRSPNPTSPLGLYIVLDSEQPFPGTITKKP